MPAYHVHVRNSTTLLIEAGKVLQPKEGTFVQLGLPYGGCDLAPPDRTRSNVCHAAALISISAWAWAGVL